MLTIIFLISLLIFPLYASAYTYNIPFRNISRKEGLNDLTVSALFKDSKGYMWIGTATSIEQFDGMYMTHYPFPGNDNKSKWVNDIKESPWGTILAGNENGLWEKRGDSFVPFYQDSIKGIVRKIIPDESGNIYVSSGKGIWLCNSSKILRHIILDSTPVFGNNEVISFCFNGDCLWAVTSNVLYKVSTKDFKVEKFSDDSFIRNDLHSYREIVSIGDKLYIATLGDGIHTFETETNSFGRFIDVGSNVINDLTSDGKDVLHIATDGNGIVYDIRHNAELSYKKGEILQITVKSLTPLPNGNQIEITKEIAEWTGNEINDGIAVNEIPLIQPITTNELTEVLSDTRSFNEESWFKLYRSTSDYSLAEFAIVDDTSRDWGKAAKLTFKPTESVKNNSWYIAAIGYSHTEAMYITNETYI